MDSRLTLWTVLGLCLVAGLLGGLAGSHAAEAGPAEAGSDWLSRWWVWAFVAGGAWHLVLAALLAWGLITPGRLGAWTPAGQSFVGLGTLVFVASLAWSDLLPDVLGWLVPPAALVVFGLGGWRESAARQRSQVA